MADRYQALLGALPRLRQYVFCITGSRDYSDDIIKEWLLSLLSEDVEAAEFSAVRGVFARFHRHGDRQLDRQKLTNGRSPAEEGLHARVLALPVRERQVLVLSAVIGFSNTDVAAILDIQPRFVRRLLHRAENGLKRARHTALVIEDEALQGIEIARALSQMGFEVAPLVSNRRQALASVARFRPDLIIADLRLANGDDGIDTVRSICSLHQPAIVYVTAFPERARDVDDEIRGPVLSKPVAPAKLMTTVHAEMARWA